MALNARFKTAAILAPAVIAAILWFPAVVGAVIFALFLGLASWEWTAVIGFRRRAWRLLVGALVLLIAAVCYQRVGNSQFLMGTQFLAVVLWLLIILLIFRYQRSQQTRFVRWARSAPVCIVLLVGAWCGIVALLHVDPTMLLLIFVCVWVADSAAFFVGRRYGRNKLASKISPGKTWEGVLGGLGFSFLALLGSSQLLVLSDAAKVALVVVGMLAVCASIVGDLFESILKRTGGLKDSGDLLPGHGGILDRIDGLIAAVPVFSLGFFLWINKL